MRVVFLISLYLSKLSASTLCLFVLCFASLSSTVILYHSVCVHVTTTRPGLVSAFQNIIIKNNTSTKPDTVSLLFYST